MTRGLLSTSLFHQLNNNRYFVNIFTNIGKKRLSLSSSKSTRICEIYHNHRLRIISTFPFAVKHFIITSPTIVTLLTILYYIILLCQEISKDIEGQFLPSLYSSFLLFLLSFSFREKYKLLALLLKQYIFLFPQLEASLGLLL